MTPKKKKKTRGKMRSSQANYDKLFPSHKWHFFQRCKEIWGWCVHWKMLLNYVNILKGDGVMVIQGNVLFLEDIFILKYLKIKY